MMVSPDWAHSFRVFWRSVSSRLSGMVLMAMELLSSHDQLVAFFPPDDQDDYLVSFDIIQGTQVPCPKLELGQRIGTQLLDRFRRRRGLVFEPGQDSRFQDSLLTYRQGPQLSF